MWDLKLDLGLLLNCPKLDLEDYCRMTTYATENAEILRQILEHLSTEDLLELSLVNKLWNYEARSVMRKRGTLRANITAGGRGHPEAEPCAKLVAFASDLRKMRVVPFIGIHIDLYHNYDCHSISNASELDASYKILDRLPWKHFSLNFCSGWKDCGDCPTLAFVRQILEVNCGVLEELTLSFRKEELLRSAFQGRSLPGLKILTVDKADSSTTTVDGPLNKAFIRSLVSRAPNLKELRVTCKLNLMESVLEGSSAVLVPCPYFRPLLEPICESLMGSVRANKMEIRIQNQDVDPSLLNRFIPKLLEASSTTLKTLSMDVLFAVPLMCYGMSLKNVTALEIQISACALDRPEPPNLALLMGLDFTRVFPKLHQVTLLGYNEYDWNFSVDVVSAFVERGNEVAREVSPDRAINIKRLKFADNDPIKLDALPLLAQIFPNVKTIEMYAPPQYFPAILRQTFACLEELLEKDFWFDCLSD